ncbi:MAG: hypothetical protein WBD07_11495 [Vicinamibacterales bacterium]
MKRAVVGVIVGYLAWTALWLGGNALLFGAAAEVVGAGQPYTAAGPLAGVNVLSVVCSLAAGAAAATISRARAGGTVLVMAALLLATGIVVQAGVWTLMPVWHHLTFLLLIVPAAILGGRLVK